MPALMNVNEFVTETRDDFNSPTTSNFISRMGHCRQTVSALEESLDSDRDGLTKMKKAIKAIYNGGNAHNDNEVYLSKALERLGANAMTKDQEPDLGAAFIKFSIVTKELSALMKTLMQNLNNIIMFPLDNILKGDLKGVKGDIKKPFDKAWKEYETKISKIEKEKKQQAKEVGLIRTEISGAEIAEEMDRERKLFQLQMCEYLIKVNEIKTKKGVELLQHLVEYYNAQTNYFRDGLKTIEHFNGYISELSLKLQKIRQKQDDERKNLIELRSLLKSSPIFADNTNKEINSALNFISNDRKDVSNVSGYSLHQMQGNKNFGYSKAGHLLKKSEGKMRVKVWQKRKCEVRDGFLYIYHSDESKPPTKVNLLTCQIKSVNDEKRAFDVISYNRTYHFQTEDETDTEAWIAVLINSKEGALKKEFDNNQSICSPTEEFKCNYIKGQSLRELQQTLIAQIQGLPGNDRCVDCNSTKDPTWLSTNFGVLICIECSGIHREMGVHVSRIQSLTLDNIGTSQLLLARVMTNTGFNDIMEGTLSQSKKPMPDSSMESRNQFIREKYIDRKFIIKTCSDENDLKSDLEHAVLSRHLLQLLQAFAEGSDLSWILPNSSNDENSLHFAVAQEDGTTLHIVDFLVQNSLNLNHVTKDGNTALHYCVIHNQSECMKLLLRSNANFNIKNKDNKTPLDLAKDNRNNKLIELLENAALNTKTLFENVCVDWSLLPEDPSTDFSDDDIADDKLNVNPSDARPSSLVGSESPSSKSSDSFKQPNRKIIRVISAKHRSSLKKRYAPGIPAKPNKPNNDSIPLSNHNRTASDVTNTLIAVNQHHWRNNSIDLSTNSNVDSISLENKIIPIVKTSAQSSSVFVSSDKAYGTSLRPTNRPPPPPDSNNLNTCQSVESLPSFSSESEDCANRSHLVPVPPPRKRCENLKHRRCLALYDCEADREDELAFKEGEVLIVLNDITDDDEWMEGVVEGQPERRGVFPVSFVHFLKE